MFKKWLDVSAISYAFATFLNTLEECRKWKNMSYSNKIRPDL